MSLSFSNLTIKRSTSESKVDFGAPSSITQQAMQDISSFFQPFGENSDIQSSTLLLKNDTIQIEIVKDYVGKAYRVNSEKKDNLEDLNIALSKLLGFNMTFETLGKRIIDISKVPVSTPESLQSLITSLDSVIQLDRSFTDKKQELEKRVADLTGKIKSALPEDQNAKFEKLGDIKNKIASLQDEVDFYQNEKKLREETNNKIKKNKSDQENSLQMADSVKLLLERKNSLLKEMTKFDGLASDPSLENKVTTIKRTRLSQINQRLIKVRQKGQTVVASINDTVPEFFLSKPVLMLIILQLIATIALYLLSYESRVLIIGFVGMVLNSIVLVLINLTNKPVYNLAKNPRSVQRNGTQVTDQSQNEDQFLINAAWVLAIKGEIAELDKGMALRLNGRSYDQIQSELLQKQTEEKSLQSELENLNKKALTSEEYYKKRRELDILKIEKENIEYGFNESVTSDKTELDNSEKELSELNKRILGIQNSLQTLPIVLINSQLIPDNVKEYIGSTLSKRQVALVSLLH